MQTITQVRPNLGRMLERKARLIEFKQSFIKIHVPPGGLRDPKEILLDFNAELAKLAPDENWQVDAALAVDVDMSKKTLFQEATEAKDNIINTAKENLIIKKIIKDLVEAEVVDVL